MTKLLRTEDPWLCKAVTNSTLVTNWIKASTSRVWKGCWSYPISELKELVKFCESIGEEIQIEQSVLNEFLSYKDKLEKLKKIKDGTWLPQLTNPNTFTSELLQYQPKVVAQMLLMHKYVVAVDTGLGKTVISLFSVTKLRSISPIKCLIVCEANQIHDPWFDNIREHTTYAEEVLVIEGDAATRDALIEKGKANMDKYWLWIVGYDTMRIDAKKIPKDWGIIIYDEVTKTKNIATKTADALRDVHGEYIWGLSATPIINTIYDLYGIYKLVQPYLFTTKQNFTEKYLDLDFFHRPIGMKKERIPELMAKIWPWYEQVTNEDAGVSKDVQIRSYSVPLTKVQQEVLDDVNTRIDNLETTLFENSTNLRRLCNMAKVFEKYKDLPVDETTNKVKVLKELLRHIVREEGKRVIMFSFFTSVLAVLKKELESEYKLDVITGDTKKTCSFPTIKDCETECKLFTKCRSIKKIKGDFKKGKIEILLGSDSLQKAHNFPFCDTVINFDLPWTSAELKQRIGRIYRVTNPSKILYVHNIVTESTTEERIIKSIEQKEKDSGKVMPKYNVQMTKLSKTVKVIVEDGYEL